MKTKNGQHDHPNDLSTQVHGRVVKEMTQISNTFLFYTFSALHVDKRKFDDLSPTTSFMKVVVLLLFVALFVLPSAWTLKTHSQSYYEIVQLHLKGIKLYDLLKVSPTATEREIASSFRKLARQ